MNKTLFIASLKSNTAALIIITLVLFMYSGIMISIYDADRNTDVISQMMDAMPEFFGNMFGFNDSYYDLTSYIGSYLYGFIFTVFPSIYFVLAGYKLVGKMVNSGSMAYLLSTPNSRIKIITTQAVFHIISFAVLVTIQTIFGILVCSAGFPGNLDTGKYILLNIVNFTVLLAAGGLVFLVSCIFNSSTYSLAFAAGIPVFFFLVKMISSADPSLDKLKYLSLFSLINAGNILGGGNYSLSVLLIMALVSAILYSSSVFIFNRRSLSTL